MPRAEVGSTKYLANKMKAKGLQRLRWYCQVCGKQARDENGFKQHTLSEGHVRQMMHVGENAGKYISDYSNQFRRDFIQLLRSSHGEKQVYINHFYQEYIRDKEHVHMNATRWSSLTEFAKFLGREGICRVEEGERGLQIQWIDNSPEAVARKEDIKKKEQLAKGDEALESKLLAQQVRRAKAAREESKKQEAERLAIEETVKEAPKEAAVVHTKNSEEQVPEESEEISISFSVAAPEPATTATASKPLQQPVKPLAKPGNPFGNPFAKKAEKRQIEPEPQKKMSNAERIMKEEIERKKRIDERGAKRQRMA